ncbi:MAG: MerR family transcriptional regulator [Bacteroidales bacterium]|nr:MerR family transcriptional regulator [Bacteroidales bacterium]MBQ2912660.1 MerR family transcriptional regulator [Bacteroidales bacterium]MBR2477867.1 MerR family transcriptional regulator [Bacteroidales bacterium]
MPYKEKPVEKLYYTIGEVSEILGENASLVRFWAGKFPDFIKPARNKKGNRLFTARDLANFKVIYYLVKERGMTLEGAAKRMKDNITGEDKRVEVISMLTSIKEKLQNISRALDSKDEVEEEASYEGN